MPRLHPQTEESHRGRILDTVPGDVVIAFRLKRQPICVMLTKTLTKAHVGRLDIVLSHP
jgi:hypothetical protein